MNIFHDLPIACRLAVLLPLAAVLAACAAGPGGLKAGDTMAAARAQMGPPTGEHPRADGGRRLEYARGPAGRQTFMLDFNAQGRLVQVEQVLTEKTFATIQPGISADELRQRIGRPSRVWGVRYHDQTVWTYRFETFQCLVFNVGILPGGQVEDAGYGPDPECDPIDRSTP